MLAEGKDRSNKGGGSTVWTITVAFGRVEEFILAFLKREVNLKYSNGPKTAFFMPSEQ